MQEVKNWRIWEGSKGEDRVKEGQEKGVTTKMFPGKSAELLE